MFLNNQWEKEITMEIRKQFENNENENTMQTYEIELNQYLGEKNHRCKSLYLKRRSPINNQPST